MNRSDENLFNEYLMFIAIRHVRHTRILQRNFTRPTMRLLHPDVKMGLLPERLLAIERRILFESGSNP